MNVYLVVDIVHQTQVFIFCIYLFIILIEEDKKSTDLDGRDRTYEDLR